MERRLAGNFVVLSWREERANVCWVGKRCLLYFYRRIVGLGDKKAMSLAVAGTLAKPDQGSVS
jgi:hypothetical protein